jgi:hypothetical protein
MSPTSTTTAFATVDLVRFLVARVDDDEQALRKLARRIRDSGPAADQSSVQQLRTNVLAQRKILGYVQELLVLSDLPREKVVRDIATQILRSMAQPYSEHAMFRSEWAS